MSLLIFICGLLSGFISGVGIILYRQNKTNAPQITNLQNQLENERKKRIIAEANLDAANQLRKESNEELKRNFEALISRAILQNNDEFVNLAGQSIEKLINKSKEEIKDQTNVMRNLISPLKDNFSHHESILKEFQMANSNTLGSLKTHLEELAKTQKNLEKETGALVTALKAPKVRGRWGEIGLKRIVEFSGMSTFCDFNEQVYNETTGLRPDMIVNLPDCKQIIVDSKVPLNAYLDAMEAENDDTRNIALSKHAKAVASHIKNLASKEYWAQFEKTVDFVVLYIEIEPAFGAALLVNKNLIEDALKNRIILATPTTLITMLQTIAFSWRQHSATENAMKIFELSSELYERLSKFSEHFQKIGLIADNLAKTYNAAVGSWENRVIPSIRKIEEQGIISQKNSIQIPQKNDTAIRDSKL